MEEIVKEYERNLNRLPVFPEGILFSTEPNDYIIKGYPSGDAKFIFSIEFDNIHLFTLSYYRKIYGHIDFIEYICIINNSKKEIFEKCSANTYDCVYQAIPEFFCRIGSCEKYYSIVKKKWNH